MVVDLTEVILMDGGCLVSVPRHLWFVLLCVCLRTRTGLTPRKRTVRTRLQSQFTVKISHMTNTDKSKIYRILQFA